jgi:NitT/TauT family transport system substrate-binding protein
MQWGLIVANTAFLEQEPDLVEAILRGCKASNRFAREHQEDFIEFGARHYRIDEETMASSLARELVSLHNDCDIDLEGLDMAIQLQRRLGAFTTPLRADEIIDLRYLPS